MGTRSTTRIYEDGNLLLTLYKQYDGYIEGWGNQLKEFIKSGTFVNGISLNEKRRVFNGVGCFAAQLIKEYKERPGGLYVTTEEDEQEYNYRIYKRNDKLIIECDEDETFTEEFDLTQGGYK